MKVSKRSEQHCMEVCCGLEVGGVWSFEKLKLWTINTIQGCGVGARVYVVSEIMFRNFKLN